ncbi:zinc finger protein OZF-like isoform X1 [Vanessa tameamea]|uniref:Zinc finger protein OZF-like isoform X1 n=1 Tax=Vanessa tameamea TaxID=334116 RepID=A0A8B8HWC0_VANTA|nr:zinc finger protein OZF-like isoform X1 [Vanessa tameamea]
MDKCGICLKPTVPLFETGKDGVYACFKCQPLVPEVTLDDNNLDDSEQQSQSSNKDEDNEGSLYCNICNKSFQKSMQLQNHMRNHRAERRFVCTYCNKAFSQSNNLRAHLRIHTNERPYKCQECGKAFTQVTNLNNHVRLHTGERPFVCPEPGCNKAYAQVTNLNQHRKRHMTGRPMEHTYDCTVCGERFSQRNHMYTHRREAHDIKSPVRSAQRHACKLCAVSLPSERHLQLHMEQHAHDKDAAEEHNWGVSCVFSSCGVRLSSAREHTEHLLRAHQLRVLAAHHAPPRRGRPPKIMKDPLELSNTDYDEVKIIKEEPQYLPKLKVQSLFQ